MITYSSTTSTTITQFSIAYLILFFSRPICFRLLYWNMLPIWLVQNTEVCCRLIALNSTIYVTLSWLTSLKFSNKCKFCLILDTAWTVRDSGLPSILFSINQRVYVIDSDFFFIFPFDHFSSFLIFPIDIFWFSSNTPPTYFCFSQQNLIEIYIWHPWYATNTITVN